MAHAYFSNGELEISSLPKQQNKSFFLSDYEKSVLLFISQWVNGQSSWLSNTSGSTGNPKTIELFREKMIYSARQTIDFLKLQTGSTGLLSINGAFVGGKMMMARCLLNDMNLVIRQPSDHVLTTLSDTPQVNFAAFVPLQVYAFLNDSEQKTYFSAIDQVIIGGAPLSPHAAASLKTFTNHCWQTYGMTETYSHVALKGLSAPCESHYFTAIGDADFSIDNENRLIINGTITDHQPLQTNDVVRLLDEKRFEWVARYDHAINTGGIKVYPEVLEAKIVQACGHLFGPNAFFIDSLPDERLGQKIVLYVEGQMDHSLLASALSHALDRYEIPKEIFFRDTFVYTLTGKINRQASVNQAD